MGRGLRATTVPPRAARLAGRCRFTDRVRASKGAINGWIRWGNLRQPVREADTHGAWERFDERAGGVLAGMKEDEAVRAKLFVALAAQAKSEKLALAE